MGAHVWAQCVWILFWRSILYFGSFSKVLFMKKSYIHTYVWKHRCIKTRMLLQKLFLPNCFKVWEPRSFHGNGLFSRAESAAYANFKVPIVEEPLKNKEKVQHHTWKITSWLYTNKKLHLNSHHALKLAHIKGINYA